MKRLSILFLFLLTLTGWAITPEEIIDIKERAENGDSQSQHYLGVMYILGDGVTKDIEEGIGKTPKIKGLTLLPSVKGQNTRMDSPQTLPRRRFIVASLWIAKHWDPLQNQKTLVHQ